MLHAHHKGAFLAEDPPELPEDRPPVLQVVHHQGGQHQVHGAVLEEGEGLPEVVEPQVRLPSLHPGVLQHLGAPVEVHHLCPWSRSHLVYLPVPQPASRTCFLLTSGMMERVAGISK